MTCHSTARSVSTVRRQSARRIPPYRPPVPAQSAAVGLTVTLQAVPNLDHDTRRHERTIRVPAKRVAVSSLTEAAKAVGAFISEFDLGSGNFTGRAGLVCRDGVPLCRVSYELRLWAVDAQGKETGKAFAGESGRGAS